jgi:hypothetical protein
MRWRSDAGLLIALSLAVVAAQTQLEEGGSNVDPAVSAGMDRKLSKQ